MILNQLIAKPPIRNTKTKKKGVMLHLFSKNFQSFPVMPDKQFNFKIVIVKIPYLYLFFQNI